MCIVCDDAVSESVGVVLVVVGVGQELYSPDLDLADVEAHEAHLRRHQLVFVLALVLVDLVVHG